MAGERAVQRTTTVSGGGLSIGGGSAEQVVADNINTFQKTIPASTTNGRVSVPITVANVKAIAIIADKACTIKTNSTSAPDDTLTMVANKGLNWLYGDAAGNKFITVDVTDLYITTTDATVIKILIAEDSTPVLD